MIPYLALTCFVYMCIFVGASWKRCNVLLTVLLLKWYLLLTSVIVEHGFVLQYAKFIFSVI
ncbi:hypothetical protein HanPI659440_Chr14g0547881 [Helianthus annuus]|nr:hypothetical protein HanPI659440_Chr14g0547881 [Helianthus annuus]